MTKQTVLCLSMLLGASLSASYIGVGAGYLIDSEEEYLTVRFGGAFSTPSEDISHNLEIEVGYTSDSEAGLDGDIIPVMLNYRYAVDASDKLNFSVGAGAGAAFVDISGYGVSDDDVVFGAQTFATVGYRVTPSIDLSAGVRYIWLDDAELFGYKASLDDDVAIELSATFHF